jgi:hypothetical protein
VILDLHGKSLHGRVEAGSFWNSPTLHHTIELQPQVEMEMAGGVFLDYEAETASTLGRGRLLS